MNVKVKMKMRGRKKDEGQDKVEGGKDESEDEDEDKDESEGEDEDENEDEGEGEDEDEEDEEGERKAIEAQKDYAALLRSKGKQGDSGWIKVRESATLKEVLQQKVCVVPGTPGMCSHIELICWTFPR